MDPHLASSAVLPQPISESLIRFAQLLVPYGLRLQLIGRAGQTLPMHVHRPSTRVAEPLTAGEHRIAILVATGQTNREVARRLFVSTKTVETHLTHIYRKTGVRSRTELAYLVASTAD